MSSVRKGGYGTKKIDPLNKKIPENPRYAHIKSSIDTGASINRYLAHLEELKQNYRFRKDEIFKRLKVTTFAQLILQVELHTDLENGEEDDLKTPEPLAQVPAEDPPLSHSPPDTARSTLSSVISGMGEMDFKEPASQINSVQQVPPPPATPPPYLLLDIRPVEDYELSHIITAKHYPAAMLSRSCNYFTKDILDYKNKPGRIIIVYDEDERLAPQVATTFIQREVDNVFMLSGGMKVLNKHFPGCMITGKLPASCLPSPSRGGIKSSSNSRLRPQQSSLTNRALITTPRGDVELRDKFTEEDLDKIQTCLDDALLSSSSSSSRLSSRSSTSTGGGGGAGGTSRSIASSRASKTSRTETPWKY